MSKALVIGAAGFVGSYLAEALLKDGWQVDATRLPGEPLQVAGVHTHELDILDAAWVETLLATLKPDVIFHLAAQSSVGVSWKKPVLTAEVNIIGTINLLEAVRGSSIRMVLVGSGEEYGPVLGNQVPVKETTPPNPNNIYAVTKNTQNQLGRVYHSAYGSEVISTRSFNHMGPRQEPTFVVADFCRQIALIEKGLAEPVIRVGNLSAKRDFTDVRDVVKAYALLARKGQSGETYNVGTGKAVEIEDILNLLLELSTHKIAVEVNPDRFRPVDVPLIEADTSKIYAVTGWTPNIPLQQTLQDTLEYWRLKTC